MVPYSGYIEINLTIPQFPQYEETIIMLVILDSKKTYGIPVQIGNWVIWKVMQMVNEQNFNELMEASRNTYISTVTMGQLPLGETTRNVFNLSIVKGPIITSMEVSLCPFEMQIVSSVSKVIGHVR